MTAPSPSAVPATLDLAAPGAAELGGVPEGFDALVLADLARLAARRGRAPALCHIVRDDARLAAIGDALAFFAPEVAVLALPAWDCLPYDRVSPGGAIVSRRLATLAALARGLDPGRPAVVLTTVNAAVQRLLPRRVLLGGARPLAQGNRVDMGELAAWLAAHGFERASTVRDPASFAVRGGILDVFPAGSERPVRLDFFGDTLDSLRAFDPETQRTTEQLARIELVPTGEVLLDEDSIHAFRAGYRERFGTVTGEDPLYEAISEGRRAPGMEHWLPLFHPALETLFDYVGEAVVSLDARCEDVRGERMAQIADYYGARLEAREMKVAGAAPYNPLPPEALYLGDEEWAGALAVRPLVRLSPFETAAGAAADPHRAVSLGGRIGRNFAAERAHGEANVFEVAAGHIAALRARGRRTAVACWSSGSAERMGQMLADHGLDRISPAADWPQALALPRAATALVVLGMEMGFETDDIAVVCEQDILGDRLVRPRRRARRAADFLTEATSLSQGDLVVHVDHGIGRFEGLRTIEAAGAPHDCLELVYAGGDKLYLPVENIELLSRYGSEESDVALDRLGGAGWQHRKARLKQRIREMAGELIKIAAARALRPAPALASPDGLFVEFCARFPYEETDDQQTAIDAVLGDLASGRPMDRLVCGDVGFGKTEIALRAAFVAVMAGKQVAVVVPTTLLARQHMQTFTARFRGLPVRIAQASRLVAAKDLAETRTGLAAGVVDIVIGTHALLGKGVRFKDLGLLVLDEEQHFGVAHKERLKQLRAEVHVLTLTATPIPRTLQLALTGVRDLSIIASPPVDRLAVRTFVTPFDPVIVREALLREHYRGGQSFYICPRIADLPEAEAFIREHVPEVKYRVAHGRMAAGELDEVMSAFYEGRFDVLVATTIIESGLDIPTANTLIVHRADMFGLAQLYQLRGRVGRSKVRAYALLTVPASRVMTAGAEKRLKVLQSLDTLGAGFQLASHDLDIRGAGNLLGEEQSGHIREVGFELYQAMLEEAVAELKSGGEAPGAGQWSPQIALGAAILLPESYVADLDLRLGLYRRLSLIGDEAELEAFRAELVDRFGPLPDEAAQLLRLVAVKLLCRRANVDRFDAGPLGAVLAFRDARFANPEGLLAFIAGEGEAARLRPDHSLVIRRDWQDVDRRLKGASALIRRIAEIAETAPAAAG